MSLPLCRTLLSACAAALPVIASTYTAGISAIPFPTDSGAPQTCSQSGLEPVSCSASLTIDGGAAFASGEASSDITTLLFPGIPFIAATVNGDANTANYPQEFVTVMANAGFDVSLTILGQPTGTPGYIGFQTEVSQPDFGHATMTIPPGFFNPTPGCPFTQGPCASFLYGVPFEVQGNVKLGVNQGLDSGSAAIGDFTIYDANFHLLESAAMPDPDGTIDVVPEPSTVLLLVSGLGLVLWRGVVGRSRVPTRPRLQL